MTQFVRTFKCRKLFLDSLATGNSVSFSARVAGSTSSRFRAWRKADANFAADWDEAEEEGTDFLEDVATERAIKKSDPLMLTILKARRPEKYDRAGKLELSGGISVEGSKAKLLNKLARLKAEGQVVEEGPEEESTLPEPEVVLALPAPAEGPVRGKKRRAAYEGSAR